MSLKNIPNNNWKRSNSLFRLWLLLSKQNKIKIIIQLIFIIFNGFAEISSLALVVPFLAFLSDPNKFWELKLVKVISPIFNIDNSKDIILPLTIFFILVNILAAILRLFNIRISAYISASIGTDLSSKIYKSTLSKNYEEHLKTNTSEIVSTSTTLLDSTVGVINFFFQAMAAIFVGLSIITALFFINSEITFLALLIFGGIYGLIGITVRKRLNQNSKIIVKNTNLQVKNIQESLGGIRDIILDGLQETYINIYKETDEKRRIKLADNQFLALFPRFGIEAIALTSIAIFSYQLTKSSNQNDVLPLIGTFAFGAQRLLPSIQMTYSAWAGIKSNSKAIDAVLDLIKERNTKENEEIERLDKELKNSKKINKIIFKEHIELKNIKFNYEKSEKFNLDNINLKINKGERIGIIGPTGSGKSTLIDIIMGLLKPTSGILKVDNKNIHNKNDHFLLTNWYQNISHVPQTIYLTDKTILENIAFGIKYQKIDFDRVKKAAKVAGIDKFINKLNLNYYTRIGEDGIKISGGQRQRIGIARAIYKNCSILILDEATSALDDDTEKRVMKAIENLSRDITIIIIAHRLSTIKSCDKLIVLKEGKIVNQGIPKNILNIENKN